MLSLIIESRLPNATPRQIKVSYNKLQYYTRNGKVQKNVIKRRLISIKR